MRRERRLNLKSMFDHRVSVRIALLARSNVGHQGGRIQMTGQKPARVELVSRIPELRAFAMSLCHSRDQSDDLLQDTLLSAWAHLGDFKEGTNMGAWLYTILRNRFVNIHRRRRQRREIIGSNYVEGVATPPGQDGWAVSTDLRYALTQLPAHQRRAIILVGANGLSIAEAAAVCRCRTGTIKSRVSRARDRLTQLLSYDGADPRTGSQVPSPDPAPDQPDRRKRAEKSGSPPRSRLSSESQGTLRQCKVRFSCLPGAPAAGADAT